MSFQSDEEFIFFELADRSVDLRVANLKGTESLSGLYHFELELLSEDADITFDEMIGKSCVITIEGINHQEDERTFTEAIIEDRFIHGIVGSFSLEDKGSTYTTYIVEVVPRVWPLKYKINSRIFQEQTVEAITETLLGELGLAGDEYSWECSATYPTLEFCVQYQESEFDFLSRLLEEFGIYYFFRHDADKHTIVFHDDSDSSQAISEDSKIPYVADAQGLVTNQIISRFSYRKMLSSDKITLSDYYFAQPTMNLQVQKSDQTSNNYEVFTYPGRYREKGDGNQNVKAQMEAMLASREEGKGTSTVSMMTPGYTFELDDQRHNRFSSDYLITEVSHSASQMQAYEEYATTDRGHYTNTFTAIKHSVKFRPSPTTARPTVKGTQTAIVTGPSGEEIYTDEHGRVKVQFHWDRYGKSDENSSCWIRVSQMWAGQGYGGFSLPRIGQEVIVDFEEGNPDRPLIIGRVHHGDNRSPYKLPDKRTVSTLKSNSSKGGGGFNELRFEDEKGNEQIFIHAEKNKDIRIKNDEFKFVGNDSHTKVENDHFVDIKNDSHLTINNESFIKTVGDAHHSYDADLNQSTKGSESYSITGDRKVAITGAENVKAGMDINLEAGMNYGLKAGMKVDVKSGMTINLQAGATINLKAGSSFISIGPAGVQISGPMVMINSGGAAGPAYPAKPAQPTKVTQPKAAKEADKAEAGKVEKTKDRSMPVKPSSYGPQAKAMKAAAKSGTPFCEQCEAAKKKKNNA